MSRASLQRMVYAALCLSLCIVLPFLTGQLRDLGNALLPMHLPVLLCGLICGPQYGLIVGLAAPLLRSLMFGMPPLFPGAVGMCVELAVYGLTIALCYRLLPKKPGFVYLSLLAAMVAGRLAGGAFKLVLLGLGHLKDYGFTMFLSGYVTEALPGIALQIVLVPLLFLALRRAGVVPT
ncbi:MAG: ECF transporter S component [Clostridia bacterium]|nr:ECF transporter S component [Clostridia bacterium]